MKARSVVAVGVLLVLLFVDVLPAEHFSGIDPPSLQEEAGDPKPPRTGSVILDGLVATTRRDALALLGEADAVIAEIIDTARRESPEHPFEMFEENIAQDGRTGGFDEWQQPGPRNPWHATNQSASQGQWSYASVDEEGRYPLAQSSLLVSPMIDLSVVATPGPAIAILREQLEVVLRALETLTVPGPDGSSAIQPLAPFVPPLRTCADVLLKAAQGRGLVTLRFDHRFSLAQNKDFGRLWAYLEPPDPSRLAQQERSALPLASPLEADIEESERCTDTVLSGIDFQSITAVTGPRGQWTPVEVDLTRFAGRRVWLVWELDASDPGFKAKFWFENSQLFPVRSFYGWWIDHVRVTAPAFAQYLRLFDFMDPNLVRGDKVVVAPGTTQPVRVRLHNAGSTEADADIEIRVSPDDARIGRLDDVRLRPGEVRTVQVDWQVPLHAPTTTRRPYTLSASLLDDHPANRARMTGETQLGRDVDSVRLVTVDLTVRARQAVADVGPQDVDVTLRNTGNVPFSGSFDLTLTNTEADDPDAPVTLYPIDGSRTVVGLGLDAATQRTFTVRFQGPASKGVYGFRVEALAAPGLLGPQPVTLTERFTLLGVRRIANIMFEETLQPDASQTRLRDPRGLGFQPVLAPDIAAALGHTNNNWSREDVYDAGSDLRWRTYLGNDASAPGGCTECALKVLRGSVLSGDASDTDNQALLVGLDRVSDLRLRFTDRLIKITGSGPGTVEVRLILGTGATLGNVARVEVGGGPGNSDSGLGTAHRTLDVLLYSRALTTMGTEQGWSAQDVDVSAAIAATGLDVVRDQLALIGLAFRRDNPALWEVADVELTGVVDGDERVLLRTARSVEQPNEVGHWTGTTVSAFVHIGSETPANPPGFWKRATYTPRVSWRNTSTPAVQSPFGGRVFYTGSEESFVYTGGEVQRLHSPVFDLSGAAEPTLNLTHKFLLYSGDRARIGYQAWDPVLQTFGPVLNLGTFSGASAGFTKGAGQTCLDIAPLKAPMATSDVDLSALPAGPVRLVFDLVPTTVYPTPGAPGSVPATESDRRCGWFIAGLRVDGARKFASDLKVESILLDVPYNPFEIGLGPGTSALVNATVSNPGVFEQPKYTVLARLVNGTGAVIAQKSVSVQASLPSDAVRSHEILLDAPVGVPQDEPVRLLVEATSPEAEDFPADNVCFASPVIACQTLGTGEPLLVRRHADVVAQVRVNPLAGSSVQSRFIQPEIQNAGNVRIVDGLTFVRTIRAASGEELERRTWLAQVPLEPGQSRLAQDLNATYLDDIWWTPPPDIPSGDFQVEFVAELPDDIVPANNVSSKVIQVRTVFFADALEGNQLSEFATGDWDAEPPWRSVSSGGYESIHAYQAGSGQPLRVPPGTDASLRFPRLNLDSASGASLSFVHRYAFEEPFDAGVVEASVNGGPWHVLQPEPILRVEGSRVVEERYPVQLAASNPLVPGHDPRAQVSGYSGTRDWEPAEFNLGQLADLVRPEILQQIAPRASFNTTAGTAVKEPPRTFYNETWGWSDPDADADAGEGWLVEDQKVRLPTPRDGSGDGFLWSGTPRDQDLPFRTWANRTDVTALQALTPGNPSQKVELSVQQNHRSFGHGHSYHYRKFLPSPPTRVALDEDGPAGVASARVAAVPRAAVPLAFLNHHGAPTTDPNVVTTILLDTGSKSDATVPDGRFDEADDAFVQCRDDDLKLKPCGSLQAGDVILVDADGTSGSTSRSVTLSSAGNPVRYFRLDGSVANLPADLADVSSIIVDTGLGTATPGRDGIFSAATDTLVQCRLTDGTGAGCALWAPIPFQKGPAPDADGWEELRVDLSTPTLDLRGLLFDLSIRYDSPNIVEDHDRNVPCTDASDPCHTHANTNFQNDGFLVDDLRITRYRLEAGERRDETTILEENFRNPLSPSWTTACRLLDAGSHVVGRTSSQMVLHEAGACPSATASPPTGFQQVTGIPPANGPPWMVQSDVVQGVTRPVWRFGLPDDATVHPDSADARLVTPRIDLSRAGGRTATLEVDHRYDFQTCTASGQIPSTFALDGGAVEVQLWDPASEVWGPWTQLFQSGTQPPAAGRGGYTLDMPPSVGTPFRQFSAPTHENSCGRAAEWFSPLGGRRTQYVFGGQSGGYVTHTFSLDEFVGREVRIAFHAYSNADVARPGWFLAQALVRGDAFLGGSVDLRFRLGTDSGEEEGFWQIDDVSIVGKLYQTDVAFLPDPGLSDTVRASPGSIVWINGTLQNLGLQPQRNIVVRFFDPATPTLLRFALPTSGAVPDLVLGPFNLEEAGTFNDRVRLSVQVRVPSGAPCTGSCPSYEARVNVARSLGGGAVEDLLDNEVPGHALRTFRIQTAETPAPLEAQGLVAAPNVVTTGDAVTLRLDLVNTNLRSHDVSLLLLHRRSDQNVDTLLSTRSVRLAPEQACPTSACEWTWTAPGPGYHRITVRAATTTATGTQTLESVANVAVDRTFLAYQNKADTPEEAEEWTYNAAHPLQPAANTALTFGQAPSGATGEGRPVADFPFEWTQEESATPGGSSFRGGLSFEDAGDGARYAGYAEGALESDVIDLRGLPSDVGRLSFSYLPKFNLVGPGAVAPGFRDGVVVEVCTTPSGTCAWKRLYPFAYYPRARLPASPALVELYNDRDADAVVDPGESLGTFNRINPTPNPRFQNRDGRCFIYDDTDNDGGRDTVEAAYLEVPCPYPHMGPSESNQRVLGPPSAQESRLLHALGPQANLCGVNCPSNDPGTPLISGRRNDWQRIEFDLGAQTEPVDGNNQAQNTNPAPMIPIVDNLVRLRFRVGTWDVNPAWSYEFGQGVYIDDIRISGYAVEAAPAVQAATIRDDTTKTFHVVVVNRGAGNDVFDVAADLSGPLAGFLLEPVPPIPLGPKEETIVALRLHAPILDGVARTLPLSLPMRITSRSDPLQAADVRVDLSFEGRNHPDYEIRSINLDEPVRAGEPTTVLVTAENSGTAPAPPTSIRLYATPPDQATPFLVQSASLAESLAAGATVTRPMAWTPTAGLEGTWTLRAVINEDGALPELPFGPNEATRAALVGTLARPDLVAVDFDFLASDGLLPSTLLHGDLVRLRAVAINNGTGPAQNVEATLLVDGFALRTVTFPLVGVGEKFLVETNWPATGGAHTLRLELRTEDREGSEANNDAERGFFIAQSNLVTAGLPTDLTFTAAPLDTRMELRNDGNTEETVRLVLDLPPGWSSRIEPTSARLGPGERVPITLTIQPPTDALAGRHAGTLRFEAVSDGSLVAQRGLGLSIAPNRLVALDEIEHIRDAGTPGVVRALFRNDGNADLTFDVALRGPAGWPHGTPIRVELAPSASRRLELPVEPAPGTRPGVYEAIVEARSDCCLLASVPVRVDVPSFEAWSIDVLREEVLPSGVQFLARAVNRGNTAGVAQALVHATPPGWTAEISKDRFELEASASETFTVRLMGPLGSALPNGTLVLGLQTKAASARAEVPVAALRAAVKVDDVRGLTSRAPAEGEVAAYEVTLSGLPRGQRATVAFFVDDRLMELRESSLADARGEATVEFRWFAAAGRHIVGFQVDPQGVLRDDDRSDNVAFEDIAVSGSSGRNSAYAFAVAPPVGWLLLVVLVLARAASRRRTP